MTQYNSVKLFEQKRIRSIWDEKKESWFYSVIDVVDALTESDNPRRYWSDLKRKIAAEGGEVYEKIVQLRLKAGDGKLRLTDVADTEQLFRIIQSIPSPKAEPFKQWLAQVGRERLDEIEDPELAISRALLTYRRKGYDESWINQRLKSIEFRKALTDEWERCGVKDGLEYATLTDIISKAWSGHTTREYKNLKGLKKENLRDNMSNMELVLNILAEVTATELSQAKNPQGFQESKSVAKEGGEIAGETRRKIEARTGKNIVTAQNAKTLHTEDDPELPE